jgi:hypothetical protein
LQKEEASSYVLRTRILLNHKKYLKIEVKVPVFQIRTIGWAN